MLNFAEICNIFTNMIKNKTPYFLDLKFAVIYHDCIMTFILPSQNKKKRDEDLQNYQSYLYAVIKLVHLSSLPIASI